MIPEKTITEIREIKVKYERSIYALLKQLENEVGLQVECVNKRTTAGGTMDPWTSMDLKLKLPI